MSGTRWSDTLSVMNRVLAILLAFAVAAVPLVGPKALGCCCAPGPSEAVFADSVGSADSCCSGVRAEASISVSDWTASPCDDHKENGPCDGEGCPKSCCTMAKVLATPGSAGGLAFVCLAGGRLHGPPTGSAGSPDIGELTRPPRLATAA